MATNNARALALKLRQSRLAERFERWKSNGEWVEDAACAGHDVEGFFPERVQYKTPIVREIIEDNCLMCPVRRECLADALATRGTVGIFGGMLFPGALLTFDADEFEQELVWATYEPNIKETS